MQVSPLTIEQRGPIHGNLTQVHRHTSGQIVEEENHEWATKQATNLNMSADHVVEVAFAKFPRLEIAQSQPFRGAGLDCNEGGYGHPNATRSRPMDTWRVR